MQKSSKRYTTYDKDLILAAMKVGAQNGTHQEDIAAMIAPLLQRKASAIVSQMYLMRSEWIKHIQTESIMAYSKVRHDREEIKTIETEYNVAINPQPTPEPVEKPVVEPEIVIIKKEEPEPVAEIEELPVLQPITKPITKSTPVSDLPKIGDDIIVVVTKFTEFGAFATAKNNDISGLIHISNIVNEYVDEIEDWLYIGQTVNARIIKIDGLGRYGFSTKDVPNSNVWYLNEKYKSRAK